MLGSLINNYTLKEETEIILIQDSVEACGRGLLKAVLQTATRYGGVHVLLFEKTADQFTHGLSLEATSKLHIHDLTCDPLGWSTGEATDLNMYSDFYQLLMSQKCSPDGAAVVIDSLTPLITYRSVPYTCNLLHKLKNSGLYKGVVCLLHGDIHEEHIVQMLRHCAGCVLHVQPSTRPGTTYLCHIIHKKTTGKVYQQKEHFDLSSDYVVTTQDDVGLLPDVTQSSSVIDPTANLTFNLSLSEKEQKDRSQVVLPYTIDQKRQVSMSGTAGQGKIFYQPDEADDFDEEDPDDDLDI